MITVFEIDGMTTLLDISDVWPSGIQYIGLISDIGIMEVRVLGSLAPNRTFDNVSRSEILGGEPVPDCTPLPQGSVPIGESCVEGVSPPGTMSVPEPSTLALFATGLVGLGFVGWRRRSMQLKAA